MLAKVVGGNSSVRGRVLWRTVLSMGGGGVGWHHALGVWGCRDWLMSLAQAPVDSFIEKDKGWRVWGTGTGRRAGAGVGWLARG